MPASNIDIQKLYLDHEKLKDINSELLEAMKNGLSDMIEWRDYCVRQVDSFEGNERQMMIDLAKAATDNIDKAQSVIAKSKGLIPKN